MKTDSEPLSNIRLDDEEVVVELYQPSSTKVSDSASILSVEAQDRPSKTIWKYISTCFGCLKSSKRPQRSEFEIIGQGESTEFANAIRR